MATVRRTKSSAAKSEFTEQLGATEVKGARARKNVLDNDRKLVESQYDQMGETVWVHNISGTEFHVPPVSLKTADADSAEIFEVDEVRPFEKSELENKRFKKSLMDRKLRIVTEEEVTEIERKREQAKHRSGKVTVGIHESGLPMNKKAALNYIFDSEDIDELEAYAQLEDREFIIEAIEQRIEELEGGEEG